MLAYNTSCHQCILHSPIICTLPPMKKSIFNAWSSSSWSLKWLTFAFATNSTTRLVLKLEICWFQDGCAIQEIFIDCSKPHELLTFASIVTGEGEWNKRRIYFGKETATKVSANERFPLNLPQAGVQIKLQWLWWHYMHSNHNIMPPVQNFPLNITCTYSKHMYTCTSITPF